MVGEHNPIRSFLDEKIANYCLEHSSVPSSACEAIASYSEEFVPQGFMVSGPEVGSLIAFMARSVKAKRILEIGCFTGYSALALAEALPDDGEVITLDINEDTNRIAQEMWDRSPHGRKIQSILGPALESLNQLKPWFDLIFIDADKINYQAYLEAALELLRPGGAILADNCLYQGKVLEESPEINAQAIQEFNDYVKSREDLVSVLLPIRDGVHMITQVEQNDLE